MSHYSVIDNPAGDSGTFIERSDNNSYFDGHYADIHTNTPETMVAMELPTTSEILAAEIGPFNPSDYEDPL